MGDVKAVYLTTEPINSAELINLVRDERLGGIVLFSGEIRSITGEIDTSQLTYEAHETMALVQMKKIAEEAAVKWDANIVMSHRIGELLPGETAVVCIAACAHRSAAFECCRFLIDQIKEDVPIWKKEFGSQGQAWIAGDRRQTD